MLDEQMIHGAVTSALLLERACFHPGPWEIQLRDHTQTATRVITRDSATISAVFPASVGVEARTVEVAELLCDGECVACREIQLPEEPCAFTVAWRFAALLPEQVGA